MQSYQLGVENYIEFARRHHTTAIVLLYADDTFPIPTEDIIMGFITWLSRPPRSLAVTTIKGRLRGVGVWFLFETGQDPLPLSGGQPLPRMQLQLRAMAKLNAVTTRPRAPLTTDKLRVFLATLDSRTDLPAITRHAYSALLCLGVFGLCRISEVATEKIREFDSTEHARRGDITIVRDHHGNLSSLEFFCRASKTDVFRRSVTIVVAAAEPGTPMCPVAAVARYLDATDFPGSEPLFRIADGSFLTRGRVDSMIKDLAGRSGFDTTNARWTTHSMRAGGATSLSFLGVPAHVIQLLGRWKSECFLRYLSISHDGRRDLAHQMATMTAKDDVTRRAEWVALRRTL